MSFYQHTYAPIHLNGNLICAIDLETTGLDPSKDEILQICILPLSRHFEPSKHPDHKPFELKIKPARLDEIDLKTARINKGLLVTAQLYGMERWSAVEALEEWFKDLRLPEKKKIIPLGSNYIHDRGFLIEFMGGPLSYNAIFRSDFRDTQQMACMINDQHYWFNERVPFTLFNLTYLCNVLGVPRPRSHDATADAMATAEVYKRMLRYKDYWNLIITKRDNEDQVLVKEEGLSVEEKKSAD